MIIVAAFVIFVLMLLLPFLGALISYKANKAQTLYINQSREKNPRYFALSFAKLFEKRLAAYEGGDTIKLSHEEKIIRADKVKQYEDICDSIVYAEKQDLVLASGKDFLQEIYAANSAKVIGIERLRAIYAKRELIVGNDIEIMRWADSEGVCIIGDNCTLGMSVTSATQLIIGQNCFFKRLYAPIICLGQSAQEAADRMDYIANNVYHRTPVKELVHDVEYVTDDMTDEEGIAAFSIISEKNVTVLENIVLQGDIRSHKGIRLCDNAIVCGNLFAEEDVILGNNVRVLGSIFTQEDITAEENVVIGQSERITSVVARGRIQFSKDSYLYGFVSCEAGGVICPQIGRSEDKVKQMELEEIVIPDDLSKEVFIFNTVEEFLGIDAQGFRQHRYIKEIFIPEGVERVPRSMFFECKQLTRVTLPSTIKYIDEFAFYGCERLKYISITSCVDLISIGKSAFEGCKSIDGVELPRTLQVIDSAAFLGCTALKEIIIPKDCQLSNIGSHAFKDCIEIEQIELSPFVTNIGMSAFYNCSKLAKISLSTGIITIAEYAFCKCSILKKIFLPYEGVERQPAFYIGFPENVKLYYTRSSYDE